MHAMRVDPKGRKVYDLLDTIGEESGEEPGEGTTYNTANICSSIFATGTRPKPVQIPDLELYIHTCWSLFYKQATYLPGNSPSIACVYV
jgi:hypothetical protein